MEVVQVVVVGAGGMGREAAAWAMATASCEVLGFVDDGVDAGEERAGLSVLGGVADAAKLNARAVLGLGACHVRKRVDAQLEAAGLELLQIVHADASVGPNVTIGAGVIIGPNVTITRDAVVGRATIINFGAQIGHDANIGSHALVGPGAVLAGNVTIGELAEVGAGAVVLQGLRIGVGARVGAGAVVTRDVPAGATVVGIPARVVPSSGGQS